MSDELWQAAQRVYETCQSHDVYSASAIKELGNVLATGRE